MKKNQSYKDAGREKNHVMKGSYAQPTLISTYNFFLNVTYSIGHPLLDVVHDDSYLRGRARVGAVGTPKRPLFASIEHL